jgi:hypothetical protein
MKSTWQVTIPVVTLTPVSIKSATQGKARRRLLLTRARKEILALRTGRELIQINQSQETDHKNIVNDHLVGPSNFSTLQIYMKSIET